MNDEPARPEAPADRRVAKAAFLFWLWITTVFVGLSVIGSSHARTLAGQAHAPFWIVVAIVAASSCAVAVAFARAPGPSETTRRLALPFMMAAILLFLWEAIVVGSGAALPAPSGLIAGALGL